MQVMRAVCELWAAIRDVRMAGDLCGHLRAWWEAIHLDVDAPIAWVG